MPDLRDLSRRERQIMDIVYKLGQATVAEVMEELPDAPGYSSVRTILGVLVDKRYLWHERESHHYVYHPTTPVSTLMDVSKESLSKSDYDEIIKLVRETRKDGR